MSVFRRTGPVSWLSVAGALAVIVALVVAAAFRAPSAHAILESCDPQVDIFNDFATTGKVGYQAQLKCSNSNADITGVAAIWIYVPFQNAWVKQIGTETTKESLGLNTLHLMFDCYADTNSWKYQVRASWLVTFPSGNHYGFSQWSTIRTIPCLGTGMPGGPPGGK